MLQRMEDTEMEISSFDSQDVIVTPSRVASLRWNPIIVCGRRRWAMNDDVVLQAICERKTGEYIMRVFLLAF